MRRRVCHHSVVLMFSPPQVNGLWAKKAGRKHKNAKHKSDQRNCNTKPTGKCPSSHSALYVQRADSVEESEAEHGG